MDIIDNKLKEDENKLENLKGKYEVFALEDFKIIFFHCGVWDRLQKLAPENILLQGLFALHLGNF